MSSQEAYKTFFCEMTSFCCWRTF